MSDTAGTTGSRPLPAPPQTGIFNTDLLGIIRWSFEGDILDANDYFLRLLGYTRTDLAEGRLRWRDITPPEWEAADNAAIAHLKIHRTYPPFEKEYLHREGYRVPLLVGARLEDGSETEGFAFVVDLTEVRQAQRSLANFADAMPGIVWVSREEDGKLLSINQLWTDYTGQPSAEALAQPHATARMIHPDDMPRIAEATRLSQEGEGIWQAEYRLRGRDGTYRWHLGRAVPVLDGDGKVIRRIGTATDIDDLKRAQAETERLVGELKEAAVRQRRFLREMLAGLTEGRLRLCDSPDDLPAPLPRCEATVELHPNTLRDARRAAVRAAAEAGIPDTRTDDLITAVGEATMNAVVHAQTGEAQIFDDPQNGLVQVWVRDNGGGIAEDKIHRATIERGFTTAGTLGHGFWLILQTVDRMYLLTGASGTTVVLEQERKAAAPVWLASKMGL